MVGNPEISSGTSLAVASTFAIVARDECGLNRRASSSYLGERLVKCSAQLRPIQLKGGGWKYSRFAVTTPWSIELDKDILFVIHDNFFVIVGDDDGYSSFLLLWHRLALHAGVKFALDELIHKGSNILLIDFLILRHGIFLILDGLLNGKGWPLAYFEVQILPVLSKGLGINGSNVDVALVFFRNWFELVNELLALLGGFGKDVGKWNASLRKQSVWKSYSAKFCALCESRCCSRTLMYSA